MDIAIVMPWRDLGCPYRREAFEFVTAYWKRWLPAAELVISPGPDPFSRASAINAGVRAAKAEVIFQCDPDSLVLPSSVLDAAALAADRPGLVVCHSRFLYLDPKPTLRLYAAGVEANLAEYGPSDCTGFVQGLSTNIACFSKSTWEAAGGYEERFGVWGGDDSAFALACGLLAGEQRRLAGDWLHLWHPRLAQSVPGGKGYAEQLAILDEYHVAASEGAAAMRKLISSR